MSTPELQKELDSWLELAYIGAEDIGDHGWGVLTQEEQKILEDYLEMITMHGVYIVRAEAEENE